MIIGLLLLLILIVAVVVLLATADRDKPAAEPSPTPTYEADEGVNSVEISPDASEAAAASPSPEPDASPSPSPGSVESITITYLGDELPASEEEGCDYDVTMAMAETLQLGYTTEPEGSTETAKWTSSDEAVATVLDNGQVTAMGEGTAYITLEIGGASSVCKIRVG